MGAFMPCAFGHPPVFVPLPLVPRGNVRVILIRDLVQMSAGVFGASDSLL